ncbi:MAG: hypothetical protein R3C44_20360 [Chloroflexota bacterium]
MARYWLTLAQEIRLNYPNELVASGGLTTTPSWSSEMRDIWLDVIAQADPFLDDLTTEHLHLHTCSSTARSGFRPWGLVCSGSFLPLLVPH